MYLDHLIFRVVYINGRRYVCCSECYVVFIECDESTAIDVHGCEVIFYFFASKYSIIRCYTNIVY